MNFDFSGKNILITGGSRGIGRACAQLFAANSGNVIFTYKTNEQEANKTLAQLKPGNHSVYKLDITDAEETRDVFTQIISKYQQLHILVNNAGVYIQHSIDKVSYETWQNAWAETLATNLIGVSNLVYLASQTMIAHCYGKIINISSRGAFRGEPKHPAYGASKAGLNAMSQSLAVALAPYNISVGILAPGFVETDMVSDYLNSPEGEQVKKQSPFNRVAAPEEIARLAAVFASDGFEFATGSIVDINGASYLRT